MHERDITHKTRDRAGVTFPEQVSGLDLFPVCRRNLVTEHFPGIVFIKPVLAAEIAPDFTGEDGSVHECRRGLAGTGNAVFDSDKLIRAYKTAIPGIQRIVVGIPRLIKVRISKKHERNDTMRFQKRDPERGIRRIIRRKNEPQEQRDRKNVEVKPRPGVLAVVDEVVKAADHLSLNPQRINPNNAHNAFMTALTTKNTSGAARTMPKPIRKI